MTVFQHILNRNGAHGFTLFYVSITEWRITTSFQIRKSI
ncbi:hypothetical protein VCHA29O37_620002 [Vibrio chagasii]|nr:hypothetical protein VCHA29O37_620002 [Vibrio chagasii]